MPRSGRGSSRGSRPSARRSTGGTASPWGARSRTAAAGGIALINSVGNLGGFVGPYLLGVLKDATGSFRAGLWLLALSMCAVAGLALSLRGETRRAGGALQEAGVAQPHASP
jgi:ACS family tartrate transporter-like MFS transporter